MRADLRREPGQQRPQPDGFAVGVGAVYAITDLEPHQAGPDELAAWIRGALADRGAT